MQKVREEVILEFLVQKSLNFEFWLERYDDLKLGGLFCDFFLGLGTSLELFFKNQGSGCKILDHGFYFPRVQGRFCKISKLNQNNELFQ
jgi:hypothetical protein